MAREYPSESDAMCCKKCKLKTFGTSTTYWTLTI